MNQKGFINIVLVIIVVVLVGTGAYFVSTRQIASPTPAPSPSPTPTPTPIPTPVPAQKPNPTPTPVTSRTNWDSGKEYFYYYSDQKIPLKFVGMKDGYPSFATQDSTTADVFLTDEFIAKIKSGATREDIEALNRKYNITIVKNIYGTSDEFVLTVKSDPGNNALDMANLYHNQTIIEWAAPNFIRRYDLN